MRCDHLITMYRSKYVNPATGKRQMVSNPNLGVKFTGTQLPCGQCMGCKINKKLMWATRIVHEASLHQNNSFITLTYNDEDLPPGGSLVKSDFQKFMKRLRYFHADIPIRFYACGEYGGLHGRSHYHAILFGLHFPDRERLFRKNGHTTWTSEKLEQAWTKGFSTVKDVGFEAAVYVANYVQKKITGDRAEQHYSRVDKNTGEEIQIIPEYATMSNRPGIGHDWYANHKDEVYPDDIIILKHRKLKPPAYYDNMYRIEDPAAFEKMKAKRKRAAREREKTHQLTEGK